MGTSVAVARLGSLAIEEIETARIPSTHDLAEPDAGRDRNTYTGLLDIMHHDHNWFQAMALEKVRKHEVAFCAEVSKWADRLFELRAELPFGSSDIESFGRGTHKRHDLRFYARAERGQGSLALCGEVKLPGNPQGRSPFDLIVMQDAFNKATAENCRYFFTWNVEHLALFDRSLWDRETMHERCIGEWKLGLQLDKSTDVARPEVEARIRDEFLPKFFADFAEVWVGRKSSFTELPSDLYISILESHLAGPMGPVRETCDFLALKADSSKSFDARLRQWMTAEQQWNFARDSRPYAGHRGNSGSNGTRTFIDAKS